MKHFILFMALFLGSVSCFASNDSIYVCNKWCARKDTLLLFSTANNVIQIYSAAFKPKDIIVKSLDYKTLKISNPEIVGDTFTVLVMPYTLDKPMRLAIINKKTNKIIKTLYFNAEDVPVPVARIGHILTTEAPRMNILAQVSLKVIFPGSLYSYPYYIKQYKFKARIDKADVSYTVNGNMISRDVENAIKRVAENTIIEFSEIKASCPSCTTRNLDNLKLKVK